MSALVGDDARRSALAAVQRQILAKDANRNDPSPGKLLREVNGLPGATQVAPGPRAGTGVHKIDLLDTVDLGISAHLASFQASPSIIGPLARGSLAACAP